MSRISPEEFARLRTAVQTQDYLQRVAQEIEHLHRIVFHALPHADWERVRDSAVQILIAEIVYRYRGRPERILATLQSAERAGQTWDAAIAQLAAAIHAYFTTPLGLVMRQDLYGEGTMFIAPDAYDWVARLRDPIERQGVD